MKRLIFCLLLLASVVMVSAANCNQKPVDFCYNIEDSGNCTISFESGTAQNPTTPTNCAWDDGCSTDTPCDIDACTKIVCGDGLDFENDTLCQQSPLNCADQCDTEYCALSGSGGGAIPEITSITIAIVAIAAIVGVLLFKKKPAV
jgi:hypothetical protein